MARVVMCGTPTEHCTGAKVTVNAFLRGASPKAHASHSEAYRCHRRYLVDVLGYEDIGSRCFRPPPGVNNGYIRVLGRKSKFGAELRLGKMGERYMPHTKGRSGVVIAT
jgi:hypothetical protein